MEEQINMKNNLIQNFYIIGASFKEILSIIDLNQNINKSKTLSPQILSKFPKDVKNYNKIMDQTVIEHCFPNNFCIKKGKKYEKYNYHFEFQLENKLYQYIEKNRCLYSKMHLTCFKFYEPVKYYLELSKYIKNMKNEEKNDINDENLYKKYEIYYIPKVLCFASLMPFPNKLYKILTNIYDLYKHQSIDNKNIISYPIEKIIEKIVMSLPFPIMKDNDISLSFEFSSLNKTIFTYQRIIFSSYEFRDYYLNKSYDLAISELFLNNSEEIIVNIFKNILLENCVLFFSEHRQHLSNVVECFLNILSPFKYIYPNITILPQKYFGLIHSQEKFIFGINQKYLEDFFINNQIPINKNILIIIIKKTEKNEIKINTEEIQHREGEKGEYIISLNSNDKKESNIIHLILIYL